MTRIGENGTSPRPVNETTTTCAEPQPTELLPFLVLFAVLLAPDVSEVSIPGLLSLKRRVEEQEQRAETQRERIDLLQANYQLVATQVRQNVAVNLNGLSDLIDQKRPELDAPTAKDSGEPGFEDERYTILKSLATSSDRLRVLQAESAAVESNSPDRAALRLKRWGSLYSREIDLVTRLADQSARNPYFATLQELREGVDVAGKLLKASGL